MIEKRPSQQPRPTSYGQKLISYVDETGKGKWALFTATSQSFQIKIPNEAVFILENNSINAEEPEEKKPVFSSDVLSPRDIKIFNAFASGLTDKEIAQELDLSIGKTKKIISKEIFGPLQARHQTEAVMIALRRGIVKLDE